LTETLTERIKNEARRLGFALAGVTLPESPASYRVFEQWLLHGHHATMRYLQSDGAERRKDPNLLLPECESILVLGIPYAAPSQAGAGVASYAWGEDYHVVLPERMKSLVEFIETAVGHPVPSCWNASWANEPGWDGSGRTAASSTRGLDQPFSWRKSCWA
jgi:epoxyqueuosine reductase